MRGPEQRDGEKKVAEDSTKTRILMTAGPIFADRGYRDATVRDICDQAGVNLASIKYYFGDKSQLYLAAVKFARDSNELENGSIGESPLGDPAERLLGFVRGLLIRMGLQGESNWKTALLVRELLEPGEATREMVANHFRPQFSALLGILEELSGQNLSGEVLARCGLSVIGQCLFYRIAGPVVQLMNPGGGSAGASDIDRIARHIADFSILAMQSMGNSKPLEAISG